MFEAAVQVAGTALHYKNSLKQVLRNSGVKENGVERYSNLAKYQIFRNIWGDLDRAGAPGRNVQHQLITALANLDKPDPNVPDVAAGQRAIADLRRLALQANLLVSPEDLARDERRRATAAAVSASSLKWEQLAALNATFHELHRQSDRQRRGYDFEKLLAALFRWAELDYHGSFRTETDQIDGAVTLDTFTYLIEARWRDDVAVATDLAVFADKVERRIDATRGLFISMAGFRSTAVDRYRQAKENRLVLFDGADLAWILEGRFNFSEALRAKVQAASIQGDPDVSLNSRIVLGRSTQPSPATVGPELFANHNGQLRGTVTGARRSDNTSQRPERAYARRSKEWKAHLGWLVSFELPAGSEQG